MASTWMPNGRCRRCEMFAAAAPAATAAIKGDPWLPRSSAPRPAHASTYRITSPAPFLSPSLWPQAEKYSLRIRCLCRVCGLKCSKWSPERGMIRSTSEKGWLLVRTTSSRLGLTCIVLHALSRDASRSQAILARKGAQ
jgi:hypothetical protein